ncbi:MAG: TolC family protein [Lachnospiraceae bacterium]|nr:TolC family protein [Lachnospiraceae bacterium]
MNMKRKFAVLAALSLSLASVPGTAYADEFIAEPGQRYDAETLARIKDNVLEYEEIELLIDEYNPTLKNLRQTYQDNKENIGKDAARLKEQVFSGSGSLSEQASFMLDQATSIESTIGYGGAAAYAQLMYASEVMSQQAEQMLLSADSITQMTPQMLRLQSVETPRAALIAGAQSAVVGYEQLLLAKENLENGIELLELVYASTQTQAAAGLATQNDVLKARQSLESTQANRITIESNIQKTRQSLCTMLGWAYTDMPEIKKVPCADLTRIARMNPEIDKAAAVDNNLTRRYHVLSYETLTDGSVEQQNMARTLENEAAEIASELTNLYNQVLQKQSEYQTAIAAYELEKTKMDTAERKYSVGTIGRLEYQQQVHAYKTAELDIKTADLALFQAMETYDWAVKGNLKLSQ